MRELCQLVETTTARTLGVYGSDFYAGTPALTVNEYGKGRAYFLACRTEQAFLDQFLGYLSRTLGLRCLDADLPEGVSLNERRSADGRAYYFFQNFSDRPAEVTLPAPLSEAETGQPCESVLHLPAYGVKVLTKR